MNRSHELYNAKHVANVPLLFPVPDESLLALNAIFGDTLGKALDLVEKDRVSYFYTNQKAVGVYQVHYLRKKFLGDFQIDYNIVLFSGRRQLP